MYSNLLSFLSGLVIGSFLNVISLRYKVGSRLLTSDVLFGRSRCPFCKKTLSWYELIPLISFLIQLGRCRHCHKVLSLQYPFVELLSGAAFVLIPMYFRPEAVWIAIVLTLLLIATIDFRLSVIPDQLNLLLGVLGLALIVADNPADVSLWKDRVLGLLLGAAILGLIVLVTRGKGMGVGDLKLSAVLGFIFGLEKIILIAATSFIFGGFVAAFLIVFGKRSLKSAIPFGPFLVIASVLVLFCGDWVSRWFYGLV